MRKKLPIGIDGFEKIRTNNFYYVDKSMFIAELLQNWGEVNLFTRPRRFGKTLNLSMLKCFFEIGGRKELFNGLKISQEKELIEEYMGQFPVISVSLKSVDGLSFEAASAALRNIVGKEASRFQFLRESARLSENERERYEALIRVDQGVFAMNDELLVDSLLTLSQLLSKHYDQKVILLIDEYDVPLDKAFQAGYYDRMVSLIRNMLGNVLKTNDALFFAVLTGCLRISKESIFTGLNNLKVHTVSDSRYDEYFGFTDEDVSDLLDFYGLSSYKDIMKDWYDGYLFGKINVYCPWDVINYCDTLLSDEDAEPENYWANTSGNDIVRRLLKKADQTTKNEVEQLLNNKYIVKSVRQELTYRDINSSIDNIWSVLYSTGYLTQCGRLPGKQLKLIIPNKEVHELFTDLVKEWFQEKTLSDSAKIHRFCKAFPAGEVDMIQNMLHDYLWDSISIRDTEAVGSSPVASTTITEAG
ncbi:hypothetical protein B5E53_07990 [Eubacterium sp. An11]|uniref:AAA family ATPase n=1 Tax=Eubacterium sp. An11 TaxID=1965542 RepID=UPI000B37F15D|nr:AAA family ATPase [Eubacterium sp. An11]OUQ67560.1 hypothetical protein B5E53_07990 [Eubacterium sp. An11]